MSNEKKKTNKKGFLNETIDEIKLLADACNVAYYVKLLKIIIIIILIIVQMQYHCLLL